MFQLPTGLTLTATLVPVTSRLLSAGHGGEHAGVERGADGQLRACPGRARLRLPLVLRGAARARLVRVRDRLLPADAGHPGGDGRGCGRRSEEQTSELQSLMRISYAVFCLTKQKQPTLYHTVT